MENRKTVLQWWHNLSQEQKLYTTFKNNDLILGGYSRNVNSLTGSEIELFYYEENK